ncbi:MAG: RagB/SusD family nutrient uptake outer membrane protein [Chitinophagaceae bacterium]|jgi:starch-binding outer membrane protein, SusD/RagB family|nr:RagB/SusD family nutrient uptake outer membrane protein [Chitinophagaceae bacterium]
MKNNKMVFLSLLLLLPAVMMISGCKKFLDRRPLSSIEDDLSAGNLEGQIFGLYNAVKNYDDGNGFGGIAWLAMHDFRSDDSEKGSDLADGAEWVGIYDNFNYSKDFWGQNLYWDTHYSLIFKANQALQVADSLSLNDPSSQIYRAEARFFRAHAYFELVRTFGQVPLIKFRIYNNAQANVPKSNEAAIYAAIDEDLQFAAANLPAEWEAKFKGRVTSGAAKALLARAYIFRQNWSATLGLCQQVMASGKYELMSSYWKVFKDEGENSSESIFEYQNESGPNKTQDYGSWYGTCQGVRGSSSTDWNLGWGWNVPTQNLVDAYETGDLRRNATILYTGQSDDPSNGGYGRTLPALAPASNLVRKFWNKKVYVDPAKRISTGWIDGAYWVNQRIIRYSDVLLMAAEAANELGQGATAVNWVNDVRNRAGLGDITFVNQVQLRAAIKQERRVEFAMEGSRFFDLVRWGDASSVLAPLGYQNRNRYYPLPQGVVDRSGGVLVQNPEY